MNASSLLASNGFRPSDGEILHVLFDTLPQGIFWKDSNGVFQGANRKFLHDAGLSDVVGKTDYDMPWSRSQSDYYRECDRRILEQDSAEADIVESITGADGQTRWISTSKAPLHDNNGKAVGVIGTYLDITAKIQAQEQADFFKALIESANDPIYALDPHDGWKLAYVNDAACRHYGYSREKLLTMRVPDWDPDFSLERLTTAFEELKEKEYGLFESRHLLADGRIIPVEISATYFEHNGKGYFGGICHDISERKETELRLRLQSAAIESAGNAIVIADRKGDIQFTNPAFSHLTGYRREEVLGKNPRFLKSGKQSRSFYEELWQTILAGRIWKGELVNRRKDGSHYDEEMTIAPLRDASGEVSHFVAIKQDISQHKQTAAQLSQARDAALDSTRLKSEFLANMSHEIRTPMNAIMGMTSLLLDTKLTEEQTEFAQTVQSSAESLLTLLNDILDLSKIEAGRLAIDNEDFELRDTLEGTLDILAENAQAKRLELVGMVLPETSTHLRGDAGRLRQILLNLVGNAVKFTDNGQVVVRVFEEHSDKDSVLLRFEIEDTGIGISPKVQTHLFEAFNQGDGSITRKYGGTGLGLAISKRLVELMHGHIGMKSEPDHGSLFWFTVHLERAHIPISPAQEKLESLAGFNVLIVDDNPSNSLVLHHQLTGRGMTDHCVSSAEEALRILRARARERNPFHVAILDMHMPGTDGLTLALTMQADPELAATRKILLTSLGSRLDSATMREAGIAECLLKPVKQTRLFDCLLRILHGISCTIHTPCTQSASTNEPPLVTDLRVLLAEDNTVNQKLFLFQLKKLGYPAHAVSNGVEALAALERSAYDVVLMDCQMPEMDGYEATSHIREREKEGVYGDRKHRIIALTANAMEGDREKCLAVGMDDYLSKPVRIEHLAAILSAAAESFGKHFQA